MQLVRMRVENIKGCELAELSLEGRSVTIIGGNNHQGKSSFLDSLAIALGGARRFPAEPIHHDKEEAGIELDLVPDEWDLEGRLPWPCKVKRTFARKDDGSAFVTRLEIQADDGEFAPTPQTLLDELLGGGLVFDPLAFVRAKPVDQAGMLKDLVGIDYTKLDKAREKFYSQRTTVNRDIKQLDGQIAGLGVPDNVATERVDVQELMSRLTAITEYNAELESKRQALAGKRQQYAATQNELSALQSRLDELNGLAGRLNDEINNQVSELDGAEPRDPSPVKQEIAAADETNRQIDRQQQAIELRTQRQAKQKTARELSNQIKQIDRQKRDLAAAADWPLEGLGFDRTGITLNDTPFADLASSEQLNCAVAIAIRKNPKFPVVVIRDGSLLDDESMVKLTEVVASLGGTCLVERVGKSECHIVFENGVGTVTDG